VQRYSNFVPGPGINLQDTGSATSFQLTMQDLGDKYRDLQNIVQNIF
jgi:hypothetical protein